MASSEARKALLRALQVTTTTEIARRCGVAPSTVSRWASGASIPRPHARAALARHCGIDGDWNRPPSAAFTKSDCAFR